MSEDNELLSPSENYSQSVLPIEKELKGIDKEKQEQINSKLEKQYPGLRELTNFMMGLHYDEETQQKLQSGRIDFPITAAIVVFPDEVKYNELLQNRRSPYHSIAITSNQSEMLRNSTLHAELWAIQQAVRRSQTKHLPDNAVLVSSVEPCPMCAEAFMHAGGQTVIYGISQDDIRGKTTLVRGKQKPFRSEPENYRVDEFLEDRDSSIQVFGGYRKDEFIEFMQLKEG